MHAPMQPSSPHRCAPVFPSFAERRSISHDLARFSLDLGLARPGAATAAHTVPYPSPPMSHSPPPLRPLSPKQDARQRPSNSISIPLEAHGAHYRSAEQHRYHHDHHQAPASATTASSSAESEHFPMPFPPMNSGESSMASAAQMSATSESRRSPFLAQPSFLPPQLPRRPKSHVASACVNCKKAHLACDVRRPCPRCVGLGKQDTCRDVQHKKRGRPRLRDERTHSFEVGQLASMHSQGRSDITSPLTSPTALPVSYRSVSHRILKSQSNDSPRFTRRPSLTPREETLGQTGGYFDERPSPRNARFNLPSPVPHATVYLTTDLVVAKSTESVRDILGYSANELNRIKSLYDIVSNTDRDKLYRLSATIKDQIFEREPDYLFSVSQDALFSAIQNVNHEDISIAVQGSRDIQETLHIRRPDGHYLRTRVQINLAKTSVFFVVVDFSLVTEIPPPLQFNNSHPSFSPASSIFTPSHPTLTSPSFLTPSHTSRLPGEPTGPQSPYSLYPNMPLNSPMESRPRSIQPESTFPSLAQYANASAPSPASSSFPSNRRPLSPGMIGPIYESLNAEQPVPPCGLQLPPLRAIQSNEMSSIGSSSEHRTMGGNGSDERPVRETPRRERIGLSDMLE
ncbi:hypothetical protein RUND412_004097 [Rhizina undulata]